MAAFVTAFIRIDGREYTDFDELSGVRGEGRSAGNLINLLSRVSAGAVRGKVGYVVYDDDGTLPQGLIACVQANCADDSVTFKIGNASVTFTEGVDFDRGASDSETAANLTAAINGNALVGPSVSASNDADEVTVEFSLAPSNAGADILMTTDDATGFVLTQIGTETAADPDAAGQAWSVLDKS